MNGFEEQLQPALLGSGLPGILCAAAEPGELLDLTSLGHVDFGSSERMSLDTSFWIASITKLATAVAVLQLAERKQLRLEDEVADYLPFFRNLEVLTKVGLVPATTRVTVQHLMTHTAGFGYESWSRPLAEHVAQQGLPAARSGLRRSLERPLLFEPGTAWNYGIGMDWAGLLVEHVAGCSLAEYLRAHVFEPLQMFSTGFAPRTDAIRAALYTRRADGSLASAPNAANPDRDFVSGGAGLYATPRDVLRLLQSILRASQGSKEEVLRPETVAEARRNQIGALEVRDLPSCAPERSRDLALSPSRKKWSHFGLLHLETQPGGRAAGSISWAGIANTFFWIDFDSCMAAVVFAQSLPFLDPSVLALVDRYERSLYAGRTAGSSACPTLSRFHAWTGITRANESIGPVLGTPEESPPSAQELAKAFLRPTSLKMEIHSPLFQEAADGLHLARERTAIARAWLAGDFAQAWRQRVDRTGRSFVLRLAAHNPPDVFVVREVFAPAFRVLEAMSQGRLSIQPLWGESSHAMTEGWCALRERRIDITACYSSRSPELGFKLFQGLFLPGLFPGAHVATLVSEMLYRKWFKPDFDRQAVRMGRLKATAGDVIFSRRPIRTLADLQGLRISASSGWHGEIYRRLGATVCMKTSPQAAAAIASGEIDATAMTDGSAQVFGVDKVTLFRLEAGGLGRLNLEYCMSPSSYDSLPTDLRAVLSAWFSGLAQAECQVFYGVGGAQARMDFARQGMATTRLDALDTARLQKLDTAVQERFVAQSEAEGLPAAEFMRDLRAAALKWEGASENELMQHAIDSPVPDINEP